jgi:hypothetical protein
MKRHLLRLVLAVLVAVTFSSCGAVNSINQTANRALQAVSRSVMR